MIFILVINLLLSLDQLLESQMNNGIEDSSRCVFVHEAIYLIKDNAYMEELTDLQK